MTQSSPEYRRTFTTQDTGRTEIRELLEALFLAELLMPSESVWLVSPWITDIELLDNRCGQFSSIVPTWDLRSIQISEVLAHMMEQTMIHIVTRPDSLNNSFLQKMRDLGDSSPTPKNLQVILQDTLHLKGLLGEDYYLSGSMNLTHNGVAVNHEGVTLDRSPASVAQARIHFQENYGGIS